MQIDQVEVNKYPIYLYIAAIEGSGHTGVEKVIVKWLSSGNFLPELEVKDYTKKGKTNGYGSDDKWIVPLIERLRLWNGEGEVPVYIRSKEGSFPSYLVNISIFTIHAGTYCVFFSELSCTKDAVKIAFFLRFLRYIVIKK